MIKHIIKEYKKGDIGIREITITFLGVTIYKYKETTTNNNIVANLTPIKNIKIKGFTN